MIVYDLDRLTRRPVMNGVTAGEEEDLGRQFCFETGYISPFLFDLRTGGRLSFPMKQLP